MVVLNVFSIFILILVGFFVCKIGMLPVSSSKYFSAIVVNIACPCAIVKSMADTETTLENAKTVGIICALCGTELLLMIVVGRLYCKLVHSPPEEVGVLGNLILFPNNGFMGMPVGEALYGPQGFFVMAVSLIITPFFQYTYGISELARRLPGSAKMGIRDFITMPLVASVIGLLVFFLDIPIEGFIGRSVEITAGCMTPLCMFVIGIQLTQSNVIALIKNYRLFGASLIKVVLQPVIIIALCLPLKLIIPNRYCLLAVALNGMMPTAAVTVVLAERYGADAKLAAEGAFLTSLFSIGTIPLFAQLLRVAIPV